jgi:hypothetical protein
MIITEPSKKPSERLIQTLSKHFLEKGFVYKKSLNQFARVIGNRKEMVSVFYNKTGNLVSATLSWAILFPDIEKVYKAINVDERQGTYQPTLWTDLLNYLPRRENNSPSSFDLYDTNSFKYDDFSINTAATELKSEYERYVEPFFEHYKDLQTLEKEMNEMPLHHHDFIGYGGRQVSIGLVLCKRFNQESFAALKEAYKQYIFNDDEDADFKTKMEMYYDATIQYLETANIEKLISV